MSAGSYTMRIERGATYTLSVTVQAGAPAVARDLTGYSARLQIREDYSSPLPVVDLDNATKGGIALTAAAGIISIVITAAQSGAIPFLSGVFDLEIQSGAVVERVLAGPVLVSPEVTR